MNDLPLDIFANYQNRPDQLVEKRAATEDIQLLVVIGTGNPRVFSYLPLPLPDANPYPFHG